MANPLPPFGAYLVSNLLTDVSADLAPDAQQILGILSAGGAAALLDPANKLTVDAFLLKAQADALKVGNDLTKQIATYASMWLAAKFPPAAA